MGNKFLVLLFSFIVTILSSFTGYSQPIKPKQLLKKVDAVLNELETVVYKIDRKDKYFTSKPIDTTRKVALCSLYLAPEDKMKAYHILDIKSQDNHYIHYKYDGNHTATVFYRKDSLETTKKVFVENVFETNYRSVSGSDFLLRDYFDNKRAFRQYNSLLAKLFFLKKTEVTEGTFMGVPVYVLTFYSKNMEKRRNYIDSTIVTHYIRKSDFLPIGYKALSHNENMVEYEYYEIEYLDINPKLPLELFKVSPNVTEIKPKEVYERIKKHKLL